MNDNNTKSINTEEIKKHLPSSLSDLEIVALESAGSTNDVARELAREKSGQLAVIAAHQTAGRGTKGRAFFSPGGAGLYMSALLRPAMSAEDALPLTAAAAAAVCEAAEDMGSPPLGIKWVNDIMLGGKKVCGILTETSLIGSSLDYAVVGIGVNIAPPPEGFPRELENVAGALFESAPEHAREKLAAGILARLVPLSESLQDGAFIDEYRRRSVIIGRDIEVVSPRGSRPARALDIDGRCSLLVRYEDGSEEALLAGEVSVRRAADDLG